MEIEERGLAQKLLWRAINEAFPDLLQPIHDPISEGHTIQREVLLLDRDPDPLRATINKHRHNAEQEKRVVMGLNYSSKDGNSKEEVTTRRAVRKGFLPRFLSSPAGMSEWRPRRVDRRANTKPMSFYPTRENRPRAVYLDPIWTP
jgi:hypothetical protein